VVVPCPVVAEVPVVVYALVPEEAVEPPEVGAMVTEEP